jgi:peptidoglycan/LPS O-acetylase OafA/YrhL
MHSISFVEEHRRRSESSKLFVFGYQPSLDGLRAVSVIAVLLYHAGFDSFQGGFLGVEVFFVISGFLITSLLLEEREKYGRVSLRSFWARRAKRLLPALVAVIVATAAWAAVFGSAQQQSSLRRELPWSVLYVNNWGQILGDTPYFAEGESLTRHLWSLAVEEQWYLIWPLVFVLLTRRLVISPTYRWRGLFVAMLAACSVIHMVIVESGSGALLSSPIGLFDGVDRINFLYLSTTTRVGGLLLGAAAALIWRPWKSIRPSSRLIGPALEAGGAASLVILGIAFVTANLTSGYVYQWLLPIVSVCSMVLAVSVTHPDASMVRSLLAHPVLVAVGTRSYGIYLWSWPISVIVGATDGSITAFMIAMAITAAVSELSFRFLETPVRRANWSLTGRSDNPVWVALAAASTAGAVALGAFYVQVERTDLFRDDEIAQFDTAAASPTTLMSTPAENASTTTAVTDTAPPTSLASSADETLDAPATAPSSTPTTTTSTLPDAAASVRLAIVGDSTANALAVNQPNGISAIYPSISNGSRDGCGVYDAGRILTSASFRNDFTRCVNWQDSWARAATEADVVLIVIGAWEVFDIEIGDIVYEFDTPSGDALFVDNLRSGIDRIVADGGRAAILEVPCMRPVESSGTPLPPLPERGDDQRVAHVNSLLRDVADEYGPSVVFVEGPDAWCTDPEIANDLALRWDGVHVYGQGAKMIYETTAPAILQLGAVPT